MYSKNSLTYDFSVRPTETNTYLMEGDGSPCHYGGNSASTSKDEELPRTNVDYILLDRMQTRGVAVGRQPGGCSYSAIATVPAPVNPEGKHSSWEGGSVPIGGGA
jgi:hypothetical protein